MFVAYFVALLVACDMVRARRTHAPESGDISGVANSSLATKRTPNDRDYLIENSVVMKKQISENIVTKLDGTDAPSLESGQLTAPIYLERFNAFSPERRTSRNLKLKFPTEDEGNFEDDVDGTSEPAGTTSHELSVTTKKTGIVSTVEVPLSNSMVPGSTKAQEEGAHFTSSKIAEENGVLEEDIQRTTKGAIAVTFETDRLKEFQRCSKATSDVSRCSSNMFRNVPIQNATQFPKIPDDVLYSLDKYVVNGDALTTVQLYLESISVENDTAGAEEGAAKINFSDVMIGDDYIGNVSVKTDASIKTLSYAFSYVDDYMLNMSLPWNLEFVKNNRNDLLLGPVKTSYVNRVVNLSNVRPKSIIFVAVVESDSRQQQELLTVTFGPAKRNGTFWRKLNYYKSILTLFYKNDPHGRVYEVRKYSLIAPLALMCLSNMWVIVRISSKMVEWYM